VAVVTTLASQGAQYLAIVLSNRNVGDLNRNVLVGLSVNILVAALATAGVAFVKPIFLTLGIVLGAVVFSVGALSDIRSVFFPRRGIGIFFGTFNPFHKTHLRIIEMALRERGLSKVLIHPTIIPKLHARALERGEIRIARVQNGLQVYERTEKADSNVNYFPTGDRFYPPETRRLMIELAIAEAGLIGKVDVAFFPETYRDYGFYGVLRKIRRQYPGQPIHCLHGSDLGGMLIRNIFDESGWMYPMAVRRRDGVSATAIRNGATAMTSAVVTETLAHLKAGTTFFVLKDRRYRNDSGLLLAA
jgi:nicotinic acid mononucleotide adenylyltransferase